MKTNSTKFLKMNSMDVKSIEEIDDPEKLLTLTPLSYSRLDSYAQCHSRYFYTYVHLAPRSFAPHAVLGNVIHTSLENVLEKDVKVADIADALIEEYEIQKKEWDPDSLIPEDLLQSGEVMLNEFIDRHSHESFAIEAKEMGFSIVIGTYLVSGYIDRVDIIGDTVYIFDYKSGRHEVSQKNVPDNLQLGLYAVAARAKFPGKKIHASLYYLKSGRIKGHLFTDEEMDAVEARVIKTASELIEDNTYQPTTNTRLCPWCDHAKSEICPTGVRARNAMPPSKRP